mmetsp:Transcript_37338/g.6688  ORF Transcript_37338/g.6688 Transcript_37338/m.6688 type:complete len:152 (+) Transcript_37338:281-736(+)|eukprot:CAMPEP_0168314226 /NCGR_PEP_ID=MMETSP0210-20121227/6805_1 /TAXON_ID=40633 /ORGANISM="Condylostoma magnum, Strain COL2" /LENGTH=151 /DNA_ID=CAMNT_0008279723 /DNA_START=285 /DNA_END=740 /DNA_ORIENTATION=+
MPKKDFINTAISSILWTIKNKYRSSYRLFSSRDEDEIFCVMQITEEWCRKRAEITCYRLQFKTDPNDDISTHPFKEVEPWAAYETERLGTVPDSIKFFKRYDLDDNEIKNDGDNNRRGGSIFRYTDKARLLLDSMNDTFDFNVMEKSGVLL